MRLDLIKDEVNVFIYGTLLPGQSNHSVISNFILSSEEGFIAARLVDVGAYPAAVRDHRSLTAASIVKGIWLTINRKALLALDELEGFIGIEEDNDYERAWVKDNFNPTLEGWSYVWSDDRGFSAIVENNWLDYLAKRDQAR
ncbi:MAG: gamma-glutamylcyclotransferase [Candidatus Pristimantibacillus sp.]